MSYDEVLEFLFSQLPMYQEKGAVAFSGKLDVSRSLDAYFGHPHFRYKTIHVAGTNGKGSTSHLIASVLQAAGYKVGLYTSPHLKDFRERIKVNGIPMDKSKVVDFVEQHQAIIQELHPSFFEMTVAMAFQYFAQEEVDYAVIEVGLGGRLDSTNIITPILSVITNISKDHVAMLGNSLVEIAGEKAGVIKSGVPVVIGEKQMEVAAVFEQKAAEESAPLFFAEEQASFVLDKETNEHVFFHFDNLEGSYKCDLTPNYQRKNITTAYVALQQLQAQGVLLGKEAFESGFAEVIQRTQLKGRWQLLQHNPLVVCETAHNEAGLRMAMQQLRSMTYRQLHLVVGFCNDKALDDILTLFPQEGHYYFTQAKIPRAMKALELQEIAAQVGLKGAVYADVNSALEAAKAQADADDLVYVGGSIFVVAEVV